MNSSPRLLIGLASLGLFATIPGCGESQTENAAPDRVTGWVNVDMTPGKAVVPLVLVNGQLPPPDCLNDFHGEALRDFVSLQNQFGARRMITFEMKHGYLPSADQWAKRAKYHFQELDDRVGETVQWELKSLQLVGLMNNPNGVAYVIPPTAKVSPDQLKSFPTRPINEFEAEALTKLNQGQNAVAFIEYDRVRMLGAVRITADCRSCHKHPEGTLMGAFSYDFTRDEEPHRPLPKPDPNAAVMP